MCDSREACDYHAEGHPVGAAYSWRAGVGFSGFDGCAFSWCFKTPPIFLEIWLTLAWMVFSFAFFQLDFAVCCFVLRFALYSSVVEGEKRIPGFVL